MELKASGAKPGRNPALRKIDRHILPLLILAYIIAYVDRINIGIAALQMNSAIGLSASMFGFGAAIFSLPFLLGEIPSNQAMVRFGARRWMARIMISWGLVACAMAFIVGAKSYVLLRLLLGAAEAGLFPGVMLYFTYWYPPSQRARVVGLFQLAVPLAGFVGAPLSASLLGLNGMLEIQGWRWMFFLEGIPAICLGFVCLRFLADGPASARWLDNGEREWLDERMKAESQQRRTISAVGIRELILNPKVLLLGAVYAGSASMTASLSVWLPQIIKAFKMTDFQAGLLTAVPYGLSAVAMVLWALNSDRARERVWHVALPTFVSAVGLGLCVVYPTNTIVFVLLCVAVCTNAMGRGPFWALASEWLPPAGTAVGLALINTIGTFAVILCTYLIGVLKDYTGNFYIATLPLVVVSLLSVVAVLAAGAPARQTKAWS